MVCRAVLFVVFSVVFFGVIRVVFRGLGFARRLRSWFPARPGDDAKQLMTQRHNEYNMAWQGIKVKCPCGGSYTLSDKPQPDNTRQLERYLVEVVHFMKSFNMSKDNICSIHIHDNRITRQ